MTTSFALRGSNWQSAAHDRVAPVMSRRASGGRRCALRALGHGRREVLEHHGNRQSEIARMNPALASRGRERLSQSAVVSTLPRGRRHAYCGPGGVSSFRTTHDGAADDRGVEEGTSFLCVMVDSLRASSGDQLK